MYAPTEWLELVQLAPGQVVGWQGGQLRLALRGFEVEQERTRWWSRKREPVRYHLSLQVTTPGVAAFDREAWVSVRSGFPSQVGPFHDPFSGMLEATRSPLFELHELLDVEAGRLLVRAGHTTVPPSAAASGDLAALEPAARRFVTWWQRAPSEQAWGAAEGAKALGLPQLEGYELCLGVRSTGALRVTFHRGGEQYYVRTYGGCIAPVEQWYGPYRESGGGYYLAR
jgi:hypothetical protein